jgi:hypothetical protein
MSSLIRLKMISDSIYLYNNKSKIRERGGGGGVVEIEVNDHLATKMLTGEDSKYYA